MRPTLSSPFLNTVCAVLLSSACSLALAQDPPARVGRISTVEGQVLVRAGDGDAQNALLNWPVTTDNRLTTRRGALAELRVGAAAVRLDGDSELEVSELDDDSFKLHLGYGTVSVRVRNPDALRGVELTTAQARVILTQPGWVRIEAGRQPGTSVVSVLDGAAAVDGATGSVTLRAGKRAELTDEQLRTGALQRIAFDNWPEALPAAAPALRYVTDDTTGYEELDRYGAWQDDAEYGPLWLPASVPPGWAPYSDGRWTWIAPWGWTWVDNAPWGYAPSHYGRWVLLGQRWGWAPGRERGRVPWAPALVGWVGGNHGTGHGQHPGVGWFPLSPHERYVPGYRASADYERRINRVAEGHRPVAGERERRNRTIMPAPVLQSMPLSTPPAPAGNWQRPVDAPRQQDGFRRDWGNRPGRLQTDDGQTHLAPRPMQPNRPPVPAQPQQPPMPPMPAQPRMPAVPALPPVQDQVARPGWRGEERSRAERPMPRERNNERGAPGRNGRMQEAER
ncbi:FecR family protein [Janthinobacterium sp. JC611]|uniref:FecR family protein n=1 Tax=Janthinobacterium sp. JC611 TaxID=2816201 RepID=UPI001BFD8745|nr:FecR family protein [Janthinobacterium sp. JC611]